MKRLENVFRALAEILRDARDIILPRQCAVCGRRLSGTEHTLCGECTFKLPYTNFRGMQGNPVERLLLGRFPLGRATAYTFYNHGDRTRFAVLSLKYFNSPEAGREFGKRIAAELEGSDFFEDMDVIVPVPLARRRMSRRGYNQSAMLAKGISDVTKIPVRENLLKRIVDNPTQTRRTKIERLENVKGIFRAARVERIKGKHILLVDDVITTGATVTACAEELAGAGAKLISVISFAVAASTIEKW